MEAYRKLQGLSIKERDEKLYHQLATLAAVSEKYQAYLVFDNYGSKIDALHALLCAYGRYDLNQKKMPKSMAVKISLRRSEERLSKHC